MAAPAERRLNPSKAATEAESKPSAKQEPESWAVLWKLAKPGPHSDVGADLPPLRHKSEWLLVSNQEEKPEVKWPSGATEQESHSHLVLVRWVSSMPGSQSIVNLKCLTGAAATTTA